MKIYVKRLSISDMEKNLFNIDLSFNQNNQYDFHMDTIINFKNDPKSIVKRGIVIGGCVAEETLLQGCIGTYPSNADSNACNYQFKLNYVKSEESCTDYNKIYESSITHTIYPDNQVLPNEFDAPNDFEMANFLNASKLINSLFYIKNVYNRFPSRIVNEWNKRFDGFKQYIDSLPSYKLNYNSAYGWCIEKTSYEPYKSASLQTFSSFNLCDDNCVSQSALLALYLTLVNNYSNSFSIVPSRFLNNLDPFVQRYFIKQLFNINNDAQFLVFTSNPNLLSCDVVNPDSLYMFTRDNKSIISFSKASNRQLYRANNYERLYLSGEFSNILSR